MPVQQSRSVMDAYFAALGTGDFVRFFTDDVAWTTIETGIQVRGPLAVQEYVVALHADMADLRTSQLLIGDTAAYLEGSCAGPAADSTNGRDRVRYCVAYDLLGERICAMRAYGAVSQFTDAQPLT